MLSFTTNPMHDDMIMMMAMDGKQIRQAA
jgi:hypothetical protein